MRKLLLTLFVVVLVCVSTACSRTDEGKAPVQVLLSFLSAVERSGHEPEFREQAYAYLDEHSQKELKRRAALARSLAGRELKPWEMLVPGRLTVTSRELRREGLRANVEGERATVALGEADPIELVREDGRWRVQLFPPPSG